MCELNNRNRVEDRCSEFVDIMGLKYEGDDYPNPHKDRGITQSQIFTGLYASCSGAKLQEWYENRYAAPPQNNWCGPILNRAQILGWVGATVRHDIEVVLYPTFVEEYLGK
jgi:hypothetical protein